MVEQLENFDFSPLPSKDFEEYFAHLPEESLFQNEASKPHLTVSCDTVLGQPAKPLFTPEEEFQNFVKLMAENPSPRMNLGGLVPHSNVLLSPQFPQILIHSEPSTAPVEMINLDGSADYCKKEKEVCEPQVLHRQEEEEEEARKPVNPERVFKTVFRNKEKIGDGDIKVMLKTRRDKPSEEIPERMYSSLKYVIQQTATDFPSSLAFILGRIKVLDADTLEVIKKNNKDVLKGVTENALTKPPRSNDNVYHGTLQCQFTDVSFHTDKREICYEVSYYIPDDLENAVLIKRSPPFKNFARKPNKKKKKQLPSKKEATKRNFEIDEEEGEASSSRKKQRSPDFCSFISKLEDLLEEKKKLGQFERKQAMELMISKFIEIDPDCASQFAIYANNFS